MQKLIKVIGDVCQDKRSYGVASRTSEEQQGAPIIFLSAETYQLGMAANVAAGLHALEERVQLVSVVGADVEGTWITNTAKKCTTKTMIVPRIGTITTVKHRIITNGVQFARIDREQTVDLSGCTGLGWLENRDPEEKTDIVVISDYGKGVANHAKFIIQECRERGINVLVDPKGKDWSKYAFAYVLKPNFKEFCEYAFPGNDRELNQEEFVFKAQQVRKELNIDYLIVTHGSNGCYVFTPLGQTSIAAEQVNVVDVCGAGDSFLVGLASALNRGKDMDNAIKFAQKLASIAVSTNGTAVIPKEAIKEWFD